MSKNNRGISLLELALVMVAIGLILGGIFAGRALIRSSQIVGVLSDYEAYKKEFAAFKDKYQALPGDMPNAESFWGTDTGCPSSSYTATVHTATCNGDGNGQISGYEMFRAWQHLSNAGMVQGGYVGMSASGSMLLAQSGVNVPSSTLDRGAFLIYYQGPTDATNLNVFQGDYDHILVFGIPSSSTQTMGPILTPAEAFMIDMKADDGLPGTGTVTTSPAF